jgi:hypothetical protein
VPNLFGILDKIVCRYSPFASSTPHRRPALDAPFAATPEPAGMAERWNRAEAQCRLGRLQSSMHPKSATGMEWGQVSNSQARETRHRLQFDA